MVTKYTPSLCRASCVWYLKQNSGSKYTNKQSGVVTDWYY